MYDYVPQYVDITPQVGGYAGDTAGSYSGSSSSLGGLNLGGLFSGLGNVVRALNGTPNVVQVPQVPTGATGTLVAPQSALSNPSLPMILIIGVIILLMFSKGSK